MPAEQEKVSLEQGEDRQVQALILDDLGKDAFVGEDAEYYENRLRERHPSTVVGTSVHECYKVAIPDGPQFTSNERGVYELEQMRKRGYIIRVVDQNEFDKILQKHT